MLDLGKKQTNGQVYDEAERFLRLLDPNAERFTFQTFDDNPKRKDKKLVRVIHGSLTEVFDQLCNFNDLGAGVFVTINETDFKRRTKENIVRVRALFMDLDGSPKPKDFLTPTIEVETSEERWHLYYLTGDVKLEEFTAKQKLLIAKFESDPQVQDLPRVMRLPGFFHRKEEPRLVRVTASSDAVYTSDQFSGALKSDDNRPEHLRNYKSSGAGADFKPSDFPGRSDDELKALLEASRIRKEGPKPGKWRISMLSATATMIGRGWLDAKIKETCAPYCDGGENDPDLKELIDGGRKKWKRPEHAVNDKLSDGEVALADFYAYMPDHSYIFVPTGEKWPAASVNSRLPSIPLLKKDGTAVVDTNGNPKRIKPNVWLDKHRPVEQMTWAPGEPPIIEGRLIADGGWIKRQGVSAYNLYRPPVVGNGDAAKATRWIDLVRKIYPDDADHIIAFCAQRIQHPAVKINHGLLLGGSTGIGKDTMLEPLKHGVGPWNFKEVSPQDIMDTYNDYMESVVLRISEAHDLGEYSRYAFHDRMKTIQAAPPDVIRVNTKYKLQHYVTNVAGSISTTNNRFDAIYLPSNDRRTYVAWSEVEKVDFEEGFWSSFWAWYASGGLDDVVAHLRKYDLSKFDPKAPPKQTDAFWQIVGVSAAPEESELADALDAMQKNGQRPIVTTINAVMEAAAFAADLNTWLRDPKNRRRVPGRFEACGYLPVHNTEVKDKRWVINGRRQIVYGRMDVSASERIAAARKLTEATPPSEHLTKSHKPSSRDP